jgi:hypothetical protein
MPHFEQRMPQGLLGEAHRCHQAVSLLSCTPWYMLVYETDGQGAKTLFIRWETVLLEVLKALPSDATRTLSVFQWAGDTGAWTQRQVARLWSATPSELERTGPVLMRFLDDEQVFDGTLTPARTVEGRALLFAAS